MNENVKACLDYIIEHENEDFYENPSTTHIYYRAFIEYFGIKAANKELSDAIDSQYEKKDL